MFFILCYISPSNKLVKEFIKIKTRTLGFHGVNLGNMEQVINYFRKNYNTIDYRKFVKKQKEPRIVTANEMAEMDMKK